MNTLFIRNWFQNSIQLNLVRRNEDYTYSIRYLESRSAFKNYQPNNITFEVIINDHLRNNWKILMIYD